ncbi:MAG: hypothetical protein KatS3mg105_4205 [Gemmatales bacterium]|nr:MAG: hypothetical protein KatS3mg105_4205 [Gemmatales bacterium]
MHLHHFPPFLSLLGCFSPTLVRREHRGSATHPPGRIDSFLYRLCAWQFCAMDMLQPCPSSRPSPSDKGSGGSSELLLVSKYRSCTLFAKRTNELQHPGHIRSRQLLLVERRLVLPRREWPAAALGIRWNWAPGEVPPHGCKSAPAMFQETGPREFDADCWYRTWGELRRDTNSQILRRMISPGQVGKGFFSDLSSLELVCPTVKYLIKCLALSHGRWLARPDQQEERVQPCIS